MNTAITIKNHDPSIKVVVHEKYKEIGYNHEGRRCGEAHSVEREWSKWKPTGKSIYNTILHAEVIIGKKHYFAHKSPGIGYILNRQEFICQFAQAAEKCGVVLQTSDKIKSINDLDGDVIVDGSGCPSTIKRELDLGTGFVGTSYQQTLENANCFQRDTILIKYTIPSEYFWIFPRNPEKKEVNIGVGIFGNFGYDLREMLTSFKEKHNITGTINYVTGGLVPLGLQHPFMYRNILFVGDAGVGTFPFTAQGIYRALLSGDIAGQCIAQRKIKKYPSIIRKDFMQWNVIGMTFLRLNMVFQKIYPRLFLTSLNFLVKQRKQVLFH